jgi:hypothetical protein
VEKPEARALGSAKTALLGVGYSHWRWGGAFIERNWHSL